MSEEVQYSQTKLTAERLRELLDYDPQTGIFTRRIALTSSVTVGEVAGTRNVHGYWQIKADGRLYLSHVLAWLWMTGEWPKRRLRFRNGDGFDTRWGNLRLSGALPALTPERLHEILSYNPATGEFRYRLNRGRAAGKGEAAGKVNKGDGYRYIVLDGHGYAAHRLAWFYVHGTWPNGQLDHENRVRDDNRFDNLREATPTQNNANQRRRKDNTSGFKGVSWDAREQKWIAQICCNRKNRHLGRFNEPEEAHAAYTKAANDLFGSYACIA